LGYVHTDLKPANIMYDPDEHNLVLIDFAVATMRTFKSITPPIVLVDVDEGRRFKQMQLLFMVLEVIIQAQDQFVPTRDLLEGVLMEVFCGMLAYLNERVGDPTRFIAAFTSYCLDGTNHVLRNYLESVDADSSYITPDNSTDSYVWLSNYLTYVMENAQHHCSPVRHDRETPQKHYHLAVGQDI
jgi:serine/threonine protein kinase